MWINQLSLISPQGPYGGYKQSGFGRTGGIDGLHEFMPDQEHPDRHEMRPPDFMPFATPATPSTTRW